MANVTIDAVIVGPLEVNAYIVFQNGDQRALLVDPGDEAQRLLDRIQALGLELDTVLLTHAHLDHWAALPEILRRVKVPVYLHDADRFLLDHDVNRNLAAVLDCKTLCLETLPLHPGPCTLAGLDGKVIHTPGHSPGSVVIQFGEELLTGDTLFAGGIGRSDLPGGSGKSLYHSLALLKALPPSTRIYPGHGEGSTLSKEARFNPFW